MAKRRIGRNALQERENACLVRYRKSAQHQRSAAQFVTPRGGGLHILE
jgi:hypothetical protein